MKKAFVIFSIIGSLALLSSCTMKTCVCYELVGGQMTMTDTYTDMGSACSSLSNNYRTCVEESERVNPGDVAWK